MRKIFRSVRLILIAVCLFNMCALSLPAAQAAEGLAAAGPWLVYGVDGDGGGVPFPDQLWAANPGGTGQTMLLDGQLIFHLTPAPSANLIAFLTADYPPRGMAFNNLTLNIMRLPDGQIVKSIRLTSARTEPKATAEVGEFEHILAMTMLPSLAWSPDGQQLAFIGAQDGPSADVYVYALGTDRVTRLTDGPSQGITPGWSPDGKYIVHFGVTTFGTGAGYGMAGAWAARADDSGVITLYTPGPASAAETLVGWVDVTTFLVYTSDARCGAHNLRAHNVETGAVTVRWPGYFTEAAYDPDSDQLLVSVQDEYVAQCTPGQTPGLFLSRGAEVVRVWEQGTPQVVWSRPNGIFFAGGGAAGVVAISTDGFVTPQTQRSIPLVSRDGDKLAWQEPDGTLVTGFIQPGNAPVAVADNVRALAWVG